MLDEGTFALNLTAANSNIRDLAGNALVVNGSTTWVLDATPPTVDIVDVSPDPRATSISQATLVFSEPVFDVSLSDLHLFRDGVEIALAAPNTPTTSDSITWTVSNLASLTAAAGSYLLKVAVGGTLHDAAGNDMAAEAARPGKCLPHRPLRISSTCHPIRASTSVNDIIVSFNVPITGLDLGDLRLDARRECRVARRTSAANVAGPDELASDGPRTVDRGQRRLCVFADRRWVRHPGPGWKRPRRRRLRRLGARRRASHRRDHADFARSDKCQRRPVHAYVQQARHGPQAGKSRIVARRDCRGLDGSPKRNHHRRRHLDLNNTSPLTSPDGAYSLTLNPGTNLVEAFPGNPLVVGASESWVHDATSPTVVVSDVTPNTSFDPTNSVEYRVQRSRHRR